MTFYNKNFLKQQCQQILGFYDPRVIDKSGGYHQNFLDNGEVFDSNFKQLVSSTRIIINYANAALLFDNDDYLAKAKHGLDYLENVHWQPEINGYAFTLDNHKPLDNTQFSYGYAFVLLAYATVKKAGIITTNEPLLVTFKLLNDAFWLPEHGLYADEISTEGKLSPYRGQNANMHLCEALIAAYEATQDRRFLSRATTIAENITFKQAKLSNGLVWEHFNEHFDIDWDYNKDDPKNLYRPWGFQPGHQTEWTKLLLQLHRHSPEDKWLEKAEMLLNMAFDHAWDDEHGGLIYGFSPEYKWCDDDKYFWVQAESFAAAAMLYKLTDNEKYLQYYTNLWEYCLAHFVDDEYGAWFRLLDRKNTAYNNEKSYAGAKCDYHNLGACLEVIRSLDESD